MADKEYRLPHLRALLKFAGKKAKKNVFYDAKFYPFGESESVFAVVGAAEILICRPTKDRNKPLVVLRTIQDLEIVETEPGEIPWALLNSCTWARLSSMDDVPLLCIAGGNGKVKVLNALSGTVHRILIGHGAEINDLCTHPQYPHIIASGSADHSIRIWSLLPEHQKNPCLLILGHGHAHKEGVLTCAFHQSGKYLISGGLDHTICVWALPDLSLEATTSWRDTKVIHFPHFLTHAVHSNFIDCVAFFGDLVLSKAAEEHKIVLWMITGFSSKVPTPSQDTAPLTHTFRDTRSGFLPKSNDEAEVRPFYRVLEFTAPDSDPFYMRFSLLRPTKLYPDRHHMLAYMNTKTKMMIWDFKRLRLGRDGEDLGLEEMSQVGRKKKRKTKPNPIVGKKLFSQNNNFNDPGTEPPPSSSRSSSLITDTNASSSLPPEGQSTTATSVAGSSILPDPVPLPNDGMRKYDISSPFEAIKPHLANTIPKFPRHVTARQAAWSPDGRWLVIVGESEEDGVIAVYER